MAGFLSMSWLFYTVLLFARGFKEKLPLYLITSLGFLLIAAAWSTADRFAFQPLGFDPIIVVLTGAHFHYAGFVVALLAHLLITQKDTSLVKLIGVLVLMGVPAVAFGITSSQFGGPPWLEGVAGSIMALGGVGVATVHLGLIKNTKDLFTKILLIVGAVCLMAGMILAMLYAWRHLYFISFLSIPWMYAVHGTLNSVGIGVCLLEAWGRIKKSPPL